MKKFHLEKSLENHIGRRKNQNVGSLFLRFFRSEKSKFSKSQIFGFFMFGQKISK